MKPINRRIFLKKAAAGGLGLAISSWTKEIIFPRTKGLTPTEWRDIISFARWAPSVHNLQPYKLKILSGNQAELCFDAARLLPVGDPDCTFMKITMGIFIEHLSIAADVYGYEIRIDELLSDMKVGIKGIIPFASLRVVPKTKNRVINRDLILERRTSRGCFDGDRMRESVLKNVRREAERFGHDFYWTHDENKVDAIIDLNQKTLFHDLESDAMREELDGLFRYSKSEAIQHKDGLSAECMGFKGGLMKSVFRKHEKWTKGVRKKLLRKKYMKSFKGTKTIGWFSGPFKTNQDLVTTGRMMARAWLRITEGGGYIQPFGSLITNQTAYSVISKEFDNNNNNKQLWMIFRVGYSGVPAASERLEVDDILIPTASGRLV